MQASILLASALLWVFAAPAVAQPVSADAVKATFLYRFAGYVEWPQSRGDSPFTIAIVEGSAVAQELERLLPAISIDGRRVLSRRLRGGDSLEGVHLLYLGSSTSIDARVLREAARGRPILVVSDSPRGLAEGAAINFLDTARNVRFEISLSNAHRNGLRIDSRLLSVATRVEGKAPAKTTPSTVPTKTNK